NELERCSIILNDPQTSNQLDKRWPELQPLCEEHPTISMGILFWSRNLLSNSDFLQSVTFHQTVTTICEVAKMAAQRHPLQRNYVFSVLKRALDLRPNTDGMAYYADPSFTELLRSVVKAMVDLIATGFVLPVIDHV